MDNTVIASLGELLERFKLGMTQERLWPSPETGFAMHVFHAAGLEYPFVEEVVAGSGFDQRRLREAPILASVGYISEHHKLDGSVSLAWCDGLKRLSGRDLFPTDRQSFVFRPLELLGITLGVIHVPAVPGELYQWLEDVLSKAQARLMTGSRWQAMLGAHSACLISPSYEQLTPSVVADELSELELALVRWLLIASPGLRLSCSLTEHELDLIVTKRFAISNPVAENSAQSAILYHGLRLSIEGTFKPYNEVKDMDRPKLTEAHSKAKKKIEDRVASGKQLKLRSIGSMSDLNQLNADARAWSSYNNDLLKALLTDDSFFREYQNPSIRIVPHHPSFDDRIRIVHEGIENSLGRLLSIATKLELFEVQTVSEDKSTQPEMRLLILTAIRAEYDAVCAHLTDLQEVTHQKGTVYERGNFASVACTWDVLVAEIGAGNENAAAEAERAFMFFQPNVALFIGVAGGIKNLNLGDVVFATNIRGYESGKEGKNFLPRQKVGESDYRLVQRAKADARKSDWLTRIIGNTPETPPQVLVEPIASGSKVIASKRTEIFKFLTSEVSDAVAVEMEGIGFLRAAYRNDKIHVGVVRGISDLIANKKQTTDATLQPLAARHASAFAFEVVANIDLSNM